MSRPRTLALCLASLTAVAVLTQADPSRAEHPDDILIIANRGVTVSYVTENEVRQLFLKKRTRWSGSGQDVVPINAPKGTALRIAFVERVLNMSEHEEKTHWNEQQVRFGMRAAPEFKNHQKAVFKLRGSVSYVFRKDLIPRVSKVLLVIPK